MKQQRICCHISLRSGIALALGLVSIASTAAPSITSITTTYSAAGTPTAINIAGSAFCTTAAPANCATIPTVTLGGTTLAVTAAKANTVTATLPLLANGDYLLSLTAGTTGSVSYGLTIEALDAGATGPTGPTGAAGAAGAKGATGPTGAAGTAGAKGATGATGPTGPAGTSGSATVSVSTTTTGAPGSAASVTNTGTGTAAKLNFVIPQGATGAIGTIGATGATGAQGMPGAGGLNGLNGLNGATGAVGATGATGANGLGFAFKGTWNASQTYAANDVVTINGSVYVAVAANTVQSPLNGGFWSLFAPGGATGPQGDAGPAGPVGVAGAQGVAGGVGPQGPTGSNGPIGATGPQGVQGPVGPNGQNGPTGPTGVGVFTDASYNTSVGSNMSLPVLGDSGFAGSGNSAVGDHSLGGNINPNASFNSALGVNSLLSVTTGTFNSAIGFSALRSNLTGGSNVAFGVESLRWSAADFSNTAIGANALYSLNGGSNNSALGYIAGSLLTSGSNNIHIGNIGTASDTNLIRIGDANQTQTYIAGIATANLSADASALPVVIDSATGQLGVGAFTTGPQGAVGPAGAIGPQGPQGPQGVQGVAGPVGPQGAQGQIGPTALAGAGAVVTSASVTACPNGGATVTDGAGNQASACNGFGAPVVVDSSGKIVGAYVNYTPPGDTSSGDFVLIRTPVSRFLIPFSVTVLGQDVASNSTLLFASSNCSGTPMLYGSYWFTTAPLPIGLVARLDSTLAYIVSGSSSLQNPASSLDPAGVCHPYSSTPQLLYTSVVTFDLSTLNLTPPFSLQ